MLQCSKTHVRQNAKEVNRTALERVHKKVLCKTFCPFFDVLVQELLEALKVEHISVHEDLLATDLAYYIEELFGLTVSENDVFPKHLLADLLQLYRDMLKRGGKANVFFLHTQFRS